MDDFLRCLKMHNIRVKFYKPLWVKSTFLEPHTNFKLEFAWLAYPLRKLSRRIADADHRMLFVAASCVATAIVTGFWCWDYSLVFGILFSRSHFDIRLRYNW